MSVEDTVKAWFRQRLATGALARDTEAYNQVASALPALIEDLERAAAPLTETASAGAPAEQTADEGAAAGAHQEA